MATAIVQFSQERTCMFCCRQLKKRSEVRALPCTHLICGDCLQEKLKKKKQIIKCGKCSISHQNVALDNLEVVSTYKILQCQGRNCQQEAVVYCSECPKLFCEIHQEAHDDALIEHLSFVMDIEVYRQEQSKWSKPNTRCETHRGDEVIATCSYCFRPLCGKCMDDERNQRLCRGGEHSFTSLETGVKAARQNLTVETRKLYEDDERLEKESKYLKIESANIEPSTIMEMDKIDQAVVRWKLNIDTMAMRLKNNLITSKDKIEHKNRNREREINEQLNRNHEAEKRTTEFATMNNTSVMKLYSDQKTRLKELHELMQNIPENRLVRVTGLEDPLPWKVTALRSPFYSSIKQGKIDQTNGSCKAVQSLPSGNLAHGGAYGLVGLKLMGQKYPCVTGICLNPAADENSVFIVTEAITAQKVFKININNGLPQTLKTFDKVTSKGGEPGSDWLFDRVSANAEHLVLTDKKSAVIRVFLRESLVHQFDLKADEIKEPNHILCLPDDTMIVTDYSSNLVINLTIDEHPRVVWKISLNQPQAIAVDVLTNCLLVRGINKVYVLSLRGSKLAELQCTRDLVHDMGVCKEKLVMAGESGITYYDLKYDTPDI